MKYNQNDPIYSLPLSDYNFKHLNIHLSLTSLTIAIKIYLLKQNVLQLFPNIFQANFC
jgi:hypothetical protein